jgi:integrase/recombinase XerD
MEEYIRRFLGYLQVERNSSHNTLLAYRADLGQMAEAISSSLGRDLSPSDLTPEALDEFVHWLLKQGYRATTVSRKMAAARSFIDYLARTEGLVDASLAATLRPPPTPRHQPRVLAPIEVEALLAGPARQRTPRGLRDAAILELLCSTGMRASEAVALRVEDLDLGRGVVFRRGSDGSEDQALPLGRAADSLRRYLEEGRPLLARNPDVPALFLDPRGRSLSRQGLWLVIKRWSAACGLEEAISPHTLRHTVAQQLLASGSPRKRVQELLGLSSPNTLGGRGGRARVVDGQ